MSNNTRSNIDFFVHSGSGIDDAKFIGMAPTLAEARKIATDELNKWPDQVVTIVDRFGGEYDLAA